MSVSTRDDLAKVAKDIFLPASFARDMSDDRDDRRRSSAFDFVPAPGFELPGGDVLDEIATELQAGLDGVTPDPADIEDALSGVSLPDGSELAVDTDVIPDAGLDSEEVDATVETGEEVVEIAVEGTAEAGTVLVDTGGEVVAVVVENGGEAAAEATVEIVAAALDGL